MRYLFDDFDRFPVLRFPVLEGPPPLPVSLRAGIGLSKYEAYLRVCFLRGMRRGKV